METRLKEFSINIKSLVPMLHLYINFLLLKSLRVLEETNSNCNLYIGVQIAPKPYNRFLYDSST